MNIFEDGEKVIENARESARELGFHVPKMIKKKILIAKKRCGICYGKGYLTLSFPGNHGSKDVQNIYCKCVTEKEIEVPEEQESL